MPKDSIKKFEHSTLRIGEDGFTEAHFNALVEYNDQHQNKYFTVGHKKIKFNSYVGVLQVGDVVIEVLPKGDQTNDTEKWRNALIQMLKVARFIRLEVSDRAMLESSKNHLLELLFESFLQEVNYLLRTGLVKRYIKVADNTKALKGKLVFHKNIQLNSVHKERFYNEFTFYSPDNIYNQVLKVALQIISRITNSISVATKANGMLLDLDQVTDIDPRGIDFHRLVLDRKTRSYKESLILAKMIIQNHSSDIQTGGMPLIAFLFDMNALWEKFIYRSLKKEERNYQDIHLRIHEQRGFKFWNHKMIRPDIILDYQKEGQKKQRVIIDTKWKLLSDLKPSDADLKQVYVYNMQLGSDQGFLLYPKVNLLSEVFMGMYRPSLMFTDYSHSCGVLFGNPFDQSGRLVTKFANELVQKVLYSK